MSNIEPSDQDCLLSIVKANTAKLVNTPKPKPKHKLESDIQKEIMKVFESYGWEVIRYNSRSFSPPNTNIIMNCNYNYNSGMIRGHPDVRITRNSISIGVEVKRPSKGFSDAQQKYRNNSMKYGNYTVICDSKQKAESLCKIINESPTLKQAIELYESN